jgi:hypothetical protein
MRRQKDVQRIYGYHLPQQRVTLWAVGYFLMYCALPLLGVLLALDVVLYLIFRYGFNACYGLLCFF